MLPTKCPSRSRITLTLLMGPETVNVLGNVHGGILMKLCDEAGGMAATKYAQRPSVTVAVDSMTFHSPVHIGNLVTVTAEISWVGRTSMEASVVVTAEDVLAGTITHTNTAFFVYVALDSQSRPTPVPPLQPETADEQQRFAEGAARQAARLAARNTPLKP